MRKIRKEDWFAAGLDLLSAGDSAKVTIEALAACLKVTKGSFYHHFGNLGGYTVALMQYWLEERSLAFIRRSEQCKNSGRNALLAGLAAEAGNSAELAVRAWGASSPLVKLYLRQLDSIRLKYLENMVLGEGRAAEAAANAARLEYALMVGLAQLYPGTTPEELRQIYEFRS